MKKKAFAFISVVPLLLYSCNSHSEMETTCKDSLASGNYIESDIDSSLYKANDGWYMEYRNKTNGHIIRRKYNPTQTEILAYEAKNTDEQHYEEEENIQDYEVDVNALNHRLSGHYKVTEIHDPEKYKLIYASIIFNPFIIKFDSQLMLINEDDPDNPVEWYGDTPVWLDGFKVEKLNKDNYHFRYLSEAEEKAIVDSITAKNPEFYFLVDHDHNQYGLKPFFGKNVNVRMDTSYMPDSLFLYYEEETIRFDRLEF